MRLRTVLGLLLLLPLPVAAEEERPAPLTMAEVENPARFARSLPGWSWRPAHPHLVRLDRAEGRSRLLVRRPGDWREETLLDLSVLAAEVDRRPLPPRSIGRAPPPRLRWAPSGRALVAVVKGDLVWADLEGGGTRRLTRTEAPLYDVKVAPDGSAVSFGRDHDLWVVPTDGGPPRRLTEGGSEEVRNATLDWVYPEEFGLETAAWWSPDASRIAWLQLDERRVPRHRVTRGHDVGTGGRTMRYPRPGDPNPAVRVGVTPVAGGEATWLDLGDPAPEYVCRVAWFPGGDRLAVVVLDRPQRHLRVLVCPADGGPPSTILEERDAAWVDLGPAPRFLDDDAFLWRSHREGFVAWYRVTWSAGDPTDPAAAARITPRDVDVHAPPWVSPDGDRTACEGLPHGATRSRLFLDGKAAPYDPGAGFDARALLDDGGAYALVTWSTATTPPRREVRRVRDGTSVAEAEDGRGPAFDGRRLAVPEEGSVAGPAGPVRWRLWRPRHAEDPTPRPLLVEVYAGPGSRMVRDRWRDGVLWTSFLVDRGFLVAQIDGRGTSGLGTAHVRAVQGRLGVGELEDQVVGVRALAERPDVDGERVGIVGWSFGGTMACLALTRRGDVFRAGVAGAPVTDWRLYDSIYTERYMGLPRENEAGYRESSVLEGIRGLEGHLLLLHAADDDNVHVQNTHRLVEALLRAGAGGVETMIYPRGGHGAGRWRKDVRRRTLAFLERHLRDR